MANQNRERADGLQHGIRLPDEPRSVSSCDTTPEGSDSGSFSAGASYYAMHGITANPDDDFNSMFNRLAIREGWSKTQRKKRRHEAIAGEIDDIYGTDSTKLEKWQELWCDVKIEPSLVLLRSAGRYVVALKYGALARVHVNLVNLIDHRRNRNVKLKLFPNYHAFRAWTLGGKKGSRIFPKKLAKEEGFIKALLKNLGLQ